MSLPAFRDPAALARHLDGLHKLEMHGREVLARRHPAALAADLYACVFAAQMDGRFADADLAAVEDVMADLLRCAEDERSVAA